MLFDHDVMAETQAQARAFTSRFGSKERIENLRSHLIWNPGAVVANANLDALAAVTGRSPESRRTLCSVLQMALDTRVEAVGNQVEEHARDVLSEDVGLTCFGVEIP